MLRMTATPFRSPLAAAGLSENESIERRICVRPSKWGTMWRLHTEHMFCNAVADSLDSFGSCSKNLLMLGKDRVSRE